MPSRFWKASGNALLPGSNFLSTGSASAFTPSSLGSALLGQYTADQASTVNTASSNVWTAYAGTAGALTQATTANRGTYSAGPPAKLSFDSTDELEIFASPPSVWDAILLVTTNSSNATWRTILWNATSYHSLILESGSNRLGVYQGTGFVDSGLTIAPSTQAIIRVRMDSSGQVWISVNGATMVNVTPTPTSFTQVGGTATIATIGNNNGGGQPCGDIHEFDISNGGLWTTTQAQQMEGYLSWHWTGSGSLLPVGHPYKSAAP